MESKRQNYSWLSGNVKVYSYWKYHALLLDLPVPDMDEFYFSVWCIGEFKADWNGWRFIKWDD